ncbi:hypothetical protein Q3C01_05305 [Bradyrhizobium sp. UFLA05-109]
MGVTDTQSYSHVIRNVFFDAVSADPFFASYTCRKNKMLVARPEYLPYLGVYVIDETMLPDGDGNAGEVRFIHALRIGFSVIVANNDQDALEAQLDAAYWRIMNRLWPDEYIMNLLDTTDPSTGTQNPDNTRIESIERGVRRYVWGNAAFNNETPVGEVQYDITCRHRTYWSPVIPDDLLTIDMQTGIKSGDTQDEMDQRQQLHAVYQFDPSSFSAKREFKQRSKGHGR